MTQSNPNDGSPSTVSTHHRVGIFGILARILLPVAMLAIGGYAYQRLSVEVEKEQEPPAEKKMIRTRVAELNSQDYQVVIRKNGIVQSHNQVALSAEVVGQVTRISPSFEVGSYFSAGEVLVELDDRDYKNAVALAQAQYDGAAAALELAKLNHQRQITLVKRNAAPQADLNQAVATLAQAESTLDGAKTQVDQAKRDLERTKIRAPFDGRVRAKDVGIGQSVGPGSPLGVVFAVDFAEVRLPIAGPELQYLDLPELVGDTPVDVELRDGINPASKTVWKGRIVRTEGTLDENSLELFAIARIDDPFGLKSGDPPLRIGLPVIGSIAGKILEDVVAIPRASIRQMDQVYLIDKTELTISSKTIVPVWSDEEYILIRDPNMSDGTLVSTTRIVYAPDGAKVELISDLEAENDSATKTASKKLNESAESTN
jgi:RND family efflux transporter MFP subunit